MPSINDALDQQYSLFITCTPEIKVTHCKYTSIYAQPKLSFKYTKFFVVTQNNRFGRFGTRDTAQ